MEGPGILPGLIGLAFAGVTGGMCVAHWRGKFGRGGNPDALMERLYLLTPIPVAFGLMGGMFLLEGTVFDARANTGVRVVER